MMTALLAPRHIILWRLPANGVGDNLFIAAVARELHRCYPSAKITIIAKYEELFRNNPHVDAFRRDLPRVWSWQRIYAKCNILRVHSLKRHLLCALTAPLRSLLGKLPSPYRCHYMTYNLCSGNEHYIAQMCRTVLGPGYNPTIKVELFLDPSELHEVRPLLPSTPFITIHSAGKTSFTSNKEWYPERFQAVIDAFPTWRFVQLGLVSDPPLKNCVDLRGRLSLRQAAAALQHAELNVCQEGGLVHLANAVVIRSVVIYGGYTNPEMTGYVENLNIVNQPSCSPCFPASTCPYNRRCMAEIATERVIEALRKAL